MREKDAPTGMVAPGILPSRDTRTSLYSVGTSWSAGMRLQGLIVLGITHACSKRKSPYIARTSHVRQGCRRERPAGPGSVVTPAFPALATWYADAYGAVMKHWILSLALFAVAVQAAVYKRVNEDGEVFYSDSPAPGAQRLKMPELPTYTLPPVESHGGPSRVVIKNDFYNSFVFAQPANDTTIRDDTGLVHAELQLEPELRENHSIQYYLDDKPYGPTTDLLAVNMSNLTPGRHRLSASVVDQVGNVLISTQDVAITIERK